MTTRPGTHQAKAEAPGDRLALPYQPTGQCLGSHLAESPSRRYHRRHHLSLIAVTGAWETCALPRQSTQPHCNPVSVIPLHRCPCRGKQPPAPTRNLPSLMVCKLFHGRSTPVTTSSHLSPQPRDLCLWLGTRRPRALLSPVRLD